MRGKNSPEKLLGAISKLDAVEFLGVCKILDIGLFNKNIKDEGEYEEGGRAIERADSKAEPRTFEEIWEEMCEVVWSMNRTRRRNLGRLVYAAIGKDKEK